jgi:dTDP-glucose 4,6-dehydratase
MTKRVLLTGVGGSIGIHMLTHIMSNTLWNVVGIDSFRHKGFTDRITQALSLHPEWYERLRVITHDLRAPISDNMAKQIGHIDAILNFASMTDVYDSIAAPEMAFKSNVAIIQTLLEYARKALPYAFVQVSTDEVYGPLAPDDPPHPEWAPIIPSSPYAGSKAAQEAACICYWRTFRLPLLIVNIANNFGEMQSPAKFPAIVQRLVSAGKPVTIHGETATDGSRYYLHSQNTADAILFLLNHYDGRILLHKEGAADYPLRYNIAGTTKLSNYRLAKLIADVLGKKLEYRMEPFAKTRPGHDHHYGLDGTALAKLGWRAPLEFHASLVRTIRWQQQHPHWLDPK